MSVPLQASLPWSEYATADDPLADHDLPPSVVGMNLTPGEYEISLLFVPH